METCKVKEKINTKLSNEFMKPKGKYDHNVR